MKEKEKISFSVKNSPLMFDHIAKRYDKLNRVMTFGLDRSWREAMTKLIPQSAVHWLDAATGTGDQILFALNKNITPSLITGIDLSEKMLEIGLKKLALYKHVNLKKASITQIPLSDKSVCVVTCSFGIRNVEPFIDALKEFKRVLKNGGTLLILESSRPKNSLLRFGHKLYMNYGLPLIAKALNTDPKAYSYLAETTFQFPCGTEFIKILESLGFIDCIALPKAFGTVTLYHAKNP